ncbi:hypothetical protein NDU88_001695 [Pleurodeles waltl]|uniref:Uncharacterized protein n=1 Tax=Pleurodeles waltl TaxID=8319 RepID=A0AAV7NKX6_PLEWA|nr:hypothetical protein NDU88_001695 [Pleurodeles waltl]
MREASDVLTVGIFSAISHAALLVCGLSAMSAVTAETAASGDFFFSFCQNCPSQQESMAPKTARGSWSKPGSLEQRPSQPLPPSRGVAPRSGSTSNAGKQAALKAQGALEDKQPAPRSSPVPERNCESKLDIKSVGMGVG